ncbi:MAG: hypothetical protein WCA39_02645 [Nitrososphaeraceae archaeon]
MEAFLFQQVDSRPYIDILLFTISHLYSSACSYAAIPIRIQPILMSIIFQHHETLKRLGANDIGMTDEAVNERLKQKNAKRK